MQMWFNFPNQINIQTITTNSNDKDFYLNIRQTVVNSLKIINFTNTELINAFVILYTNTNSKTV